MRLTLSPAPGFDALIDQVLGIDFTQSLQCEGRSGAVAQQAFQALAVVRFDAHAGIEGEAPTVIPVPIAAASSRSSTPRRARTLSRRWRTWA